MEPTKVEGERGASLLAQPLLSGVVSVKLQGEHVTAWADFTPVQAIAVADALLVAAKAIRERE